MSLSTASNECRWNPPLGANSCKYNTWHSDPDGLCIFHSKRIAQKKSAFKDSFLELVTEFIRQPDSKQISIVGWIFPNEPYRIDLPETKVLQVGQTVFNGDLQLGEVNLTHIVSDLSLHCKASLGLGSTKITLHTPMRVVCEGHCNLNVIHVSRDNPFDVGSIFHKEIRITGGNYRPLRFRRITFNGGIDFQFWEDDRNKEIQFDQCDVRHLAAPIDFHHRLILRRCRWLQSKSFWRKRVYIELPDETVGHEDDGFAQLESRYRHFRQYYENNGIYDSACEFSIGEMWNKAIRLREEGKSGNRRLIEWILLRVYGIISAYGNRVLRPISWLVLSSVTLAIGLSLDDHMSYEAGEKIQVLTFSDWLTAIARNLAYVALVMIRQSHLSGLEPATAWAALVTALAAVLGPILIALAILALRRKFRTLR